MVVLHALVLVALVMCVSARVATTPKPTTPYVGIHSLLDEKARTKAKTHPAFEGAGTEDGLEAWRIKNFDPIPLEDTEIGKFYKGDTYIVLKTKVDERNRTTWDIFYWIGSESSLDESGAAAILALGLDDRFKGNAVVRKEVLGSESPEFKQIFPSALEYLNGGYESAFYHVKTNGVEKRMFLVKGKRNIRVRQVNPIIYSLNTGDCSVLDTGHTIYVYVGESSEYAERLKAISVANQIRAEEHGGRGRVEIVDKNSTEVEIKVFFRAIGPGTPDLVPNESDMVDDKLFERNDEQYVILYKISDSRGLMNVSPVNKPYTRESLLDHETYVLDTAGGHIYIWYGKNTNEREKTEAYTKAQSLYYPKRKPWIKIIRVSQGAEPVAFKLYFAMWKDSTMTGRSII